jgi:hypothetical protein
MLHGAYNIKVLRFLFKPRKVLSALVAQLDVDFVKISPKVFILVLGMFVQLKILHLVKAYSSNLVGDCNIALGPLCRNMYR